jgi:hypothetical protein
MLLASFVARFFSSQAFVFLPPIQLTLMLAPRVLGSLACVCCFCECLQDEEVISRVEEDFLKRHVAPRVRLSLSE